VIALLNELAPPILTLLAAFAAGAVFARLSARLEGARAWATLFVFLAAGSQLFDQFDQRADASLDLLARACAGTLDLWVSGLSGAALARLAGGKISFAGAAGLAFVAIFASFALRYGDDVEFKLVVNFPPAAAWAFSGALAFLSTSTHALLAACAVRLATGNGTSRKANSATTQGNFEQV
jgi:hypothetical protein